MPHGPSCAASHAPNHQLRGGGARGARDAHRHGRSRESLRGLRQRADARACGGGGEGGRTLGGLTLHLGSGLYGEQWCQVHSDGVGAASSVSRACHQRRARAGPVSVHAQPRTAPPHRPSPATPQPRAPAAATTKSALPPRLIFLFLSHDDVTRPRVRGQESQTGSDSTPSAGTPPAAGTMPRSPASGHGLSTWERLHAHGRAMRGASECTLRARAKTSPDCPSRPRASDFAPPLRRARAQAPSRPT